MKKLRIAYVFNRGRAARLEAARARQCPSEFFYGALELEKRGHTVSFHELGGPPEVRWDFLFDRVVRMNVLPSRMEGRLWREARARDWSRESYDVIVATTTGLAMTFGAMRAMRFDCAPVVGIVCGLLNYDCTWLNAIMNRWILDGQTSVLFGKGEREPLLQRFRLNGPNVRVSQFGVDADFWTPGQMRKAGRTVVSVGNDGRRDYKTLIEAAKGSDIDLRLVTRRPLPDNLPPNVTVIKGSWNEPELSDVGLRDLYRAASVVAIPLVESEQPSGQSVCLQAMACGTPVVLTKTQGIWDDSMVDGSNVVMVPPGDAAALRREIVSLLDDPMRREMYARSARSHVESVGNIAAFADGMEAAVFAELERVKCE